MNRIYKYLKEAYENKSLFHAYLIGNTRFELVKDELYRFFKECLYKVNNIENNPDIILLKADEKSISKDSVKKLIKDISSTSQFNNIKVYIIDECEKLNDFAYNALLKTLEEPESNIYAFLITNNIDSVKDTIVSRCQKIYLNNQYEIEFDGEIVDISEKIINEIENSNKPIINKYNLYKTIEDRNKLINILNYILNKYYKSLNMIINEKIDNENIIFVNNNIEKISKKIIIINDNLERLNANLNKNLSIDRFIIDMWRCSYENSSN